MELGHDRVPAAGEERRVPSPDPIARDYLLLALRLGRLLPGLVDTYFGPAELKALVDAEAPRTPARLREEASAFDARLSSDVEEPDRRRWLQAQLVALEAQALMLAGDPLPYSDYVSCLFDIAPERTSEAIFEAAIEDLGRLLPTGAAGNETVADRLAAWDASFDISPDRLPAVLDWLLDRLRDRTDRLVGLPAGERIEVAFVSGRSWGSFSRYEGSRRTVAEVSRDVPCRPAGLIHMAAHEFYPGRHTEHVWKESRLVDDLGRLETSLAILNTPEALVTEGMAYLGERMVASDEDLPELLLELFDRGGLTVAADPTGARDAAEKEVRIRRALASLRPVTAGAAFLLHADGASREEVAAYLRHYLPIAPDRALQRLEFIEHPIYRTHVLAAHEGERLLRRWFELGPASEHVARYGRLLREQLTPGAIRDELSSGGFGLGGY